MEDTRPYAALAGPPGASRRKTSSRARAAASPTALAGSTGNDYPEGARGLRRGVDPTKSDMEVHQVRMGSTAGRRTAIPAMLPALQVELTPKGEDTRKTDTPRTRTPLLTRMPSTSTSRREPRRPRPLLHPCRPRGLRLRLLFMRERGRATRRTAHPLRNNPMRAVSALRFTSGSSSRVKAG